MEQTKVEWPKTRCPMCGRMYAYPEFEGNHYKPSTCDNFSCQHKQLHPELRKEVTN